MLGESSTEQVANTQLRPISEEFPFFENNPRGEDRFQLSGFKAMEDSGFRPLKLLNSLFSERVDFPRNALEELYKAESGRLHHTRNAMEDLDSDISRRQQELDLMIGARMRDDPAKRGKLERSLFELKRETA